MCRERHIARCRERHIARQSLGNSPNASSYTTPEHFLDSPSLCVPWPKPLAVELYQGLLYQDTLKSQCTDSIRTQASGEAAETRVRLAFTTLLVHVVTVINRCKAMPSALASAASVLTVALDATDMAVLNEAGLMVLLESYWRDGSKGGWTSDPSVRMAFHR